MESHLNKLDLESGEIKPETNTDMVETAFKKFTDFEASDWELCDMIRQIYGVEVDERNVVSARRSELQYEGKIISTDKRRQGPLGKSCTVWKYLPDGNKEEKTCLSSNEMNRALKKLHDYCLKANSFQKKQLKEIIEGFENE